MANGGMRDHMPTVAAFIDSLRAVFGRAEIDNVIRRGLRPDCEAGHGVFFSEGGKTLGQRMPEPESAVTATEMQIGPVFTLPKKGRR